VSGAVWPGGDAGESPRVRLPAEEWAFPRAHPRYASVLRRLGADGRFELLGLLEEGGQALLWAARDHADGERLVVVKAPDPTSKDTTVGPRLGREARLLELLDGSPQVMPLLTAGPGRQRGESHGDFESELPWLALPYRPHVLLPAAIAAANGPFAPDQAWTLGRDLAAGLEHLHDRGVVHRDLSPGNVLLTPSGVVIADLGMAWAGPLADDDVEARFTTGVTTRGGRGVTWGWLAPEAARWSSAGERPDRQPAADVFCWGLHVFAALVGRHPWAARGLAPDDREQDWMYDGRPPDLAGLDDVAVPAPFRDLVRASLSGDPGERPDATALRKGLDELPPSTVLAQARVGELEREVARVRAELAAPTAPDRTAPAPEGTPARAGGGRLPLLLPLAALLVAALVAGAALARGELRAYADAGRTERLAVAMRATVNAYAALSDEFGATQLDGAADFRRQRNASNQQVAAMLDALGDVETPPGDLTATIEALEDRTGELPNARGVVDRLASNGRVFLQSEAGSNQLESATGPLFSSLEATADALAVELRAQPRTGAGRWGDAAAELFVAARAMRSLRDQGAGAFRGGLNAAALGDLSGAMAAYRMRLEAAWQVATREQRSVLMTLTNEDAQLKRWTDDFPGLLNRTDPVLAEGAVEAQDWAQFSGALLQQVLGTSVRFLTDTVGEARQARADAVRNLVLIGGAVLVILLLFLVPLLPWHRLTRRRPTPAPEPGEPARDRVPAGVP
jgi:hypothetical protein